MAQKRNVVIVVVIAVLVGMGAGFLIRGMFLPTVREEVVPVDGSDNKVRASYPLILLSHTQRRQSMKKAEGGSPATGLNDDGAILVRVRQVIRLCHYAESTEKAYLRWNRRFLQYRRRSGYDGAPTSEDAKAFLTRLAMVQKVSASTQNQAFSALLLLFRKVLCTDLEQMAQRAAEG
ncbi:MAG: phage integrase N-terminal SAM-like domain-containing protein [Planctomycetes bacterium]|nr:phage integrase N-terminal SAM-like domain-containing protein [Planctomycetota bacterium]